MQLCLVGGAEQPYAPPFAWTERRTPEPDQMASFGEFRGVHCLRRTHCIHFGGAESLRALR